MPVSPLCLVNNGTTFVSTANGVDVSPNQVVSIKLNSITSVTNWFLQVSGTDELSSAPILTNVNSATGEVRFPNDIVTFTFPSRAGSAVGFRSEVHGTGGPLATTFGVYSLTASNNRVGFVTETREGNTTFGWAAKINPLLRSGGGGGLVGSPYDKHLPALATTGVGRELACSTGLSANPHPSGALNISVNGIWITDIGYGSISGCSCYWSSDNGLTAKNRPNVVKNDRLYWNGTTAEFNLTPNDFLDFWYDVAL